MLGNWEEKRKAEVAARTAAEQWAGAKRVARNMAEGMLGEWTKGWAISPPKVYIPSPDVKTWEVIVKYYVEGVGDVERREPYNTFPSEELTATLMILGRKR